jgi:hypothetical protein
MPCRWWFKTAAPNNKKDACAPVEGLAIAPSAKRIPVAMVNTRLLEELVDSGWRATGETLETAAGSTFLWYEKESGPTKVPLHPDEDECAEYSWQRVCDNEVLKYETDGWMTRKLCDKTNRLWVCRKKERALHSMP